MQQMTDHDVEALRIFAAKHSPLPPEQLLLDRMRDKLAENQSAKRTFLGCGLQFLSMRITQEKNELISAVQNKATPEQVWREAADVANFAAMVALNYELRLSMKGTEPIDD